MAGQHEASPHNKDAKHVIYSGPCALAGVNGNVQNLVLKGKAAHNLTYDDRQFDLNVQYPTGMPQRPEIPNRRAGCVLGQRVNSASRPAFAQ